MCEKKELWIEQDARCELQLVPVEVVDYNEERIKTLEKLLGYGDMASMELKDLVALVTSPQA